MMKWLKENLILLIICLLLVSPVILLFLLLFGLSSGLEDSPKPTYQEKCEERGGTYSQHKSSLNFISESCEYNKD